MALDPRLILQNDPGQFQRSFGNALLNLERVNQMRQQQQQAPLQNQLLQAQVQQQQTAATQQQRNAQLKGVAQSALQVLPALQRGDTASALAAIQSSPLPEQDKAEALEQLRTNPQALMQEMTDTISTAERLGVIEQDPLLRQTASQFGSSLTLEDEQGNLFTQTQRRSPSTGVIESVVQPLAGGPAQPQGKVSIVSSTGETPSARIGRETVSAERTAKLARKTKAIEVAVKKGGQAFDRIEPIQTAIRNYDDAISAIDEGAETGVIDRFLPNIRESSIKLDNVVKRLGLDVVGNTTFGALSENELKFALQAAIPDNLQPAQLKEWLTAKKRAQQKVLERVQEAASFLSSGENTLKDWIEFDQARQLNAESQNQQQAQPTVTPPAQGAQQIGRFIVEPG